MSCRMCFYTHTGGRDQLWLPLPLSSSFSSLPISHLSTWLSWAALCVFWCILSLQLPLIMDLSRAVSFLLARLEPPGLPPPLAPLSTSTSFLSSLSGRATAHAVGQLDELCEEGWCTQDRMHAFSQPKSSKHCFRLRNPWSEIFWLPHV